jgi:putative ABC transport system permease protein
MEGRTVYRRLVGICGLAIAQLRYERARTLFAVCGITVAVLSVTLLASSGMGVLSVGEQQFDAADRDLWVTAGPLGLTTVGGGGLDNSFQGGHEIAAEMAAHEEVRVAAPLAFQTVYVSSDTEEFETVIGVGKPSGNSISFVEGDGFSGGDQHYNSGSYDGPLSQEIVIDQRTAQAHDVSVGDSLFVGGTLSTARQNEYTVVGISETFSGFVAAPTAVVHLSELQTLTGTSGTDTVTMIILEVEEGAEVAAVQSELQQEFPALEVRTNEDQLESIVGDQATLIAGAALLVGLAIVSGAVLTIDLLLLFVSQHRRELATLSALGLSSGTVTTLVVSQGLVLGILGLVSGVVLTYPLARLLNMLAEWVVGYEGLVTVDSRVFVVGAVIAIGIGGLASLVAAWRLPSGEPLRDL